MDVHAMVREADVLRAEAARLLRDARVIERLGEYGAVSVGGSYRWNLMTRSDIDCTVVNPAVNLELALGALTRFIRERDFHGFAFLDWDRPTPSLGRPAGYVLGMACTSGGRDWRIETLFVRTPPPAEEWIEARMSEKARRTILQLKHLRSSERLAVGSYDIYRAVLLGSARDADAVREWLRAQPVETSDS